MRYRMCMCLLKSHKDTGSFLPVTLVTGFVRHLFAFKTLIVSLVMKR